MRKELYILMALAAAVFAGCIRNDVPYPHIQANFLSFEVRGQDGGTVIDSSAMRLTVTLPEEVDIESVRVSGYTLTKGAHLVGETFLDPIDLSSPYRVTVELYQQYTWQIVGRQNIERYFEVEGQIGQSIIDVPGRRVIVNVGDARPLNAIAISRAKLGPKGCTYSPSIAGGATYDGTKPFVIKVRSFGRDEIWTVYTEQVHVSLRTVGVDAWTGVAWIHGTGEAGTVNGAEYRLAGTELWTRVPQSDITYHGGDFVARVNLLSPSTSYQARVYNETMTGEIIDFTTGTAAQMPNSNFDNWWLDGKVWNPWAEDGTPFWDTGNKGATTLGQSNSGPTDDTPSGSGWAARLESKFIGIGALGKLAAGNLFTGIYVRTVGTNGVLSFGRPFTERPVRLRGQFKYTCADISHCSDGFSSMLGQPDTCSIFVALIDTDEPLEIRTAPNNRQLFDPEGAYVVGYGKMEVAQTVQEYTPFEFEIKYNSTSRKPKYIICVASASKYGDFFTGGSGSTLYVDDFELLYDY